MLGMLGMDALGIMVRRNVIGSITLTSSESMSVGNSGFRFTQMNRFSTILEIHWAYSEKFLKHFVQLSLGLSHIRPIPPTEHFLFDRFNLYRLKFPSDRIVNQNLFHLRRARCLEWNLLRARLPGRLLSFLYWSIEQKIFTHHRPQVWNTQVPPKSAYFQLFIQTPDTLTFALELVV